MSFFGTLLKRWISLFKKVEIKEIPSKTIEEKPLPKKIDIISQKPIKKHIKFINDNIIVRRIEGKNFIFDKESLKEYGSFIDDNHVLILENGYLARRQKRKNGFITFFHLWLMSKEIDEFKRNYGGSIEVDHLLGPNDNRKSSLKVRTEKEHKRRHGRGEEYWDKIERRRRELKENLK